MDCPYCETAPESYKSSRLWLIKSNWVECTGGHKFLVKRVKKTNGLVLSLVLWPPNEHHEKGSEFPIPKDITFRARPPIA
jgi:hypothetical protein